MPNRAHNVLRDSRRYHIEVKLNLYEVTSPSIGTAHIIAKAKTPKQASTIALDVIRECLMTYDKKIVLTVSKLIQPDDNAPGYCYYLNKTHTYNVTLR